MPAPSPFALHGQTMYPALFLYPLNDSFIPKHIALAGGQRVKIGRQTNAKTVPAERNGYFDSKVLSRQHAEVWEEGGKIYIKDVKSSNGTFINGERLSPEGLESDPFELKTEDIVEFGIDIVGEDNKTIVHHKVAARVACVFNDQDAANAARSDNVPPHALGMQSQAGPSGGAAFNFAGQPGGPGTQRRPALQPQGLGGMGGLGAMRAPGKSGLTFDHIISRLQGELQKSRETGAELHNLTGHMNEIHDTLGGSLPQALPPYPPNLPPVRPPQAALPAPAAADGAEGAPAAPSLTELQSQLRETRSSFEGHMDKIRALESVIAEHEVIKREVSTLRESIEEHRRSSLSPPQGRSAFEDADEHEEAHHDDDDARSVATVVPGELERVDEEDEEQVLREQQAEDEERRRRHNELGRPRTPEPTGMGMEDDEHEHARPSFTSAARSPPQQHDGLTDRLNTLANQLETALELSRSLQAQHAQQQDTIASLHEKIAALEGRADTHEKAVAEHAEAIEAIRAAPPAPAADARAERESLTEMVNEWKKNVEGQWGGVREAWETERERLRRASDEYERRTREMESEN